MSGHNVQLAARQRRVLGHLLPLPGPCDRPDLEAVVAALRTPDLPVLPLPTPMPMLGEPDITLMVAFYDAMAEATKPTDGTTQPTPPRPTKGHPPTNAYIAAEVAYMIDVEGKPRQGSQKQLHHPVTYEVRDYIGAALAHGFETQRGKHADDPTHFQSPTVKRYLSKGRAVLAALQVWPWALAPEGRLPRRWRHDDQYGRALAAWAGVPFDAVSMPRRASRTAAKQP